MPANLLHQSETYQWIDIIDLKTEEIEEISKKYNINKLLLEDCIDPNHLPKYENPGDVHFFLTRTSTSLERASLNSISDVSTKLGIFLRDNLILTVHRVENMAISKLLKDLQENKINNNSPYRIALELAQNLFISFEHENDVLLERMEKLENEIFLKEASNPSQIKQLYRFKRKVGLNLKVLNLSTEWVNSFEKLPLAEIEIKDLKDSYKDAISDFDHLNLQATNLISLFLALSDQKANQVMKTLAIYSVYFLPITFIAGVYGMNFDFMPELKQPYGYYGTLTVMALIAFFTFLYVRRKKW